MYVEYFTKPEGFALERINISEFQSIRKKYMGFWVDNDV